MNICLGGFPVVVHPMVLWSPAGWMSMSNRTPGVEIECGGGWGRTHATRSLISLLSPLYCVCDYIYRIRAGTVGAGKQSPYSSCVPDTGHTHA